MIDKEFYTDAGLNLYDYHARQYEPAIGRFTTIDRLSEKYYSISPYAYVANNPIKNIDPTGDSIFVMDGNRKYYWGYINGGYGFIGSDGTLYGGTNLDVLDVASALIQLQSRTHGRTLVNHMAGHGQSVVIGRDDQNRVSQDGNVIGWSIGCQNSQFQRPGFIGLAHELAHSQDAWSNENGMLNTEVWTSVDLPNGQTWKIRENEKYAMYVENLVRSEHNYALRTHYDINVESSRIVNYDGMSMYYSGSMSYTTRIIDGRPTTTSSFLK